VNGSEEEAGDEEEAGEVVAFEEMKEAEGEPVPKKENDREGQEDDFENRAPPWGRGSAGKIAVRFFADQVAEEGTGHENDAKNSEEAGEKVGAGRKARGFGKLQHAGRPGLTSDGDAGREEHADVRVPGNNGEEDGRIMGRNSEFAGCVFYAEGFELADENTGVGDNVRESMEEKVFRSYPGGGVHRGRGDGDDTGGTEFFGDAKSDSCAHGVSGDDGTFGKNHAAGGETSKQRGGASFGLHGSERAGRVAVTGQIGEVDAKAEFGEGASEVLHDQSVGGNTVKEYDVAAVGLREISALHGEDVHAARGSVDDVAFFVVATRGVEGKRQADDEKKNAGDCLEHLS